MQGFEWDKVKRQANVEKHGLDFVDAAKVFDDEDRIFWIDERKNYSETRFQTIGKIFEVNLIVLVVWTYRGQKRRLISARAAHSKERRLYHEK